MTENEAIKHLQSYAEVVDNMIKYCKDFEPKADITGYLEKKTVFAMAISALKEVQQYREIGTVEECRRAVEKQKPKELVYESDSVFSNGFSHYRMGRCPMCDRYYNSSDEVNYCSKCGQALVNENLEGMEDE